MKQGEETRYFFVVVSLASTFIFPKPKNHLQDQQDQVYKNWRFHFHCSWHPKPIRHTGLLLPSPDGFCSTWVLVPVTTQTGWGSLPPPRSSQLKSQQIKCWQQLTTSAVFQKASSEGYFPHTLNLQTFLPTLLAKKKFSNLRYLVHSVSKNCILQANSNLAVYKWTDSK